MSWRFNQILHARRRAKERWQLQLSIEEIERINSQFGTGSFYAISLLSHIGKNRTLCFLHRGDRKIPVVWDTRLKTITTFFPPETVPEIDQQLLECREHLRNNKNGKLNRPKWMNDPRWSREDLNDNVASQAGC